jgi:hypothetical protein
MSREEPCFEVEVLAFSQLVKWEGRVPSPWKAEVVYFVLICINYFLCPKIWTCVDRQGQICEVAVLF